MNDEIAYATAAELHRAYASGALSPVEVAEAQLARIARIDGRLRSFLTVTRDVALRAARASEVRYRDRLDRGLLDGVPIGLKDLYDTAGIPTTGNSRVFAHRTPTRDAVVVARLLSAGAVLLGKHSMTELGAGRVSEGDALHPSARNPWDLDRVPGSSSSGSVAAVAAGLCVGALGTDTGGSIRGPAHLCGVVGFKPTYDRLSRRGIIPLAPSLDHAGPIARTVADARALFLAASESVERVEDETRRRIDRIGAGELRGLRIWAPLPTVEAVEDIQPDVLAAYRSAIGTLERLGATVDVTRTMPDISHAMIISQAIVGAQALALYGPDARSRPEIFGRTFYGRLLQGALVTGVDYVDALRGRGRIARAIATAMADVDALVLPTALRSAWRLDDEPRGPQGIFMQAFNLTRQPAITVPFGMSTGLPLGLQIVARPFEDALVLAVAEGYERATTWSTRHPALAA